MPGRSSVSQFRRLSSERRRPGHWHKAERVGLAADVRRDAETFLEEPDDQIGVHDVVKRAIGLRPQVVGEVGNGGVGVAQELRCEKLDGGLVENGGVEAVNVDVDVLVRILERACTGPVPDDGVVVV